MKKYWKDIDSVKTGENLTQSTLAGDTMFELTGESGMQMPASRRNFLKLCGFSFTVAALSSCEQKISKAIPYVIAPEEIIPGEALYYASTYVNGSDYCSIIVKNRDGRPIKIEGNPGSSIVRGRTNARVQASILELYDGERFHGPLKDGAIYDWDSADKEIVDKLAEISTAKGKIVLLTPTVYSPSVEAAISRFIQKFEGSQWVQYDPVSYSAILEANRMSFGKQVIPDYRFDRANLIVSFGADFLGTWLSPIEYTRQFSSGRNPESEMNSLIQFESTLSLTGSNADIRIQIKPSQEYPILLNIYKQIAEATGNRVIDVPSSPVDITDTCKHLLQSRGKSLVISGSNVLPVQLIINEINSLLGNTGTTILFDTFLRTHAAIDRQMNTLVESMQNGEVDALLIWNVNPAYNWYNREAFIEGLKKTGLTVSMSVFPDETTRHMQYICPDSHYLESWGDAEVKRNFFSLMQPAIEKMFDTRQMAESLLKWAGVEGSFYDFLKDYWAVNMMSLQSLERNRDAFFDKILQKGVFEPVQIKGQESVSVRSNAGLTPSSIESDKFGSEGSTEIVFYETVALGEGRQANNPWLHELPDPITRICWDNYASVSPAQARELELKDGDIINLNGIELPVHVQPGQAQGTIGIALGYGRTDCGKVGRDVGKDVWPLITFENNNIKYSRMSETLTKTGKVHVFAQTQIHHTMEGRNFVREATWTEFKENPTAGNELHLYFQEHNKSLYPVRTYPHHHWGMAIDLSKCTGCGTCVIACQAENNVPVVGKEEVQRVHEMHWLRIDRYYTGSEDDPEVVFQPIPCQHCENAPCENVCPVAATNHSAEGLNQMIYNRCFGTRYCNNNCPYKVRRFNWFNYTDAGTLEGNLRDKAGMTGDLRRMVLNPDVTVRAQGVIEKCSFCIQRIQAGKLSAKKENRALLENEVQSACAQSCPADAIIFGDMNDPDSELSRLINSGRRYNLLEELYTKPSVNYLTKIRNKTV